MGLKRIMKQSLVKKDLALILSLVTLPAISATVFAQSGNREVTAFMNYELTIRLDGEALTLRDVNGSL